VLAFLSLPVVAAALGLDADDLAVLERIADDLDVRWGRDGAHRERWGYPAGITVGSWRETLDRLLAGLLLDPAARSSRPRAAPASRRRRASACRTSRASDGSPTRSPPSRTSPSSATPSAAHVRWPSGRRRCAGLVDTLLRPQRSVDASTHAYAAQAAQVREVVDALVADAAARRSTHALDVREVRAALADRMVSGGSRARLRTGHVSVASLSPLRGVPFRVVAVVGVDDTLLSRAARTTTTCSRSPRASASATRRPNGGPRCSTRCSPRATR
jgi:exodeoxyribonuclease V gamma subunit